MDNKLAPKIIYLQVYDDIGNPHDIDEDDGGVTWCADKINDSDVAYVRAGTRTKSLIEHLRVMKLLLKAARPFVADMVGVASEARGLPEEIDAALGEY